LHIGYALKDQVKFHISYPLMVNGEILQSFLPSHLIIQANGKIIMSCCIANSAFFNAFCCAKYPQTGNAIQDEFIAFKRFYPENPEILKILNQTI